MKTNSTDTRRVHTTVTFRNGERTESVVWGDVRSVHITLEPGEFPDMMSYTHGQSRLFRPERVYLEWQRNRYWGLSVSTNTWKSSDRLNGEEWVLVNANIAGTNVLKSGELGKLKETFLVANEEGWGLPSNRQATPPDWFTALVNEHDPSKGSPLDDEPKG